MRALPIIVLLAAGVVCADSAFAFGITYPGTRFCGPGRRGGYEAEPLNEVDAVCKAHDFCVRDYRGGRGPERDREKCRRCDQPFFTALVSLMGDESLDEEVRRLAAGVRNAAKGFLRTCPRAGLPTD